MRTLSITSHSVSPSASHPPRWADVTAAMNADELAKLLSVLLRVRPLGQKRSILLHGLRKGFEHRHHVRLCARQERWLDQLLLRLWRMQA
jgi:hypothetical protein